MQTHPAPAGKPAIWEKINRQPVVLSSNGGTAKAENIHREK